MKKLLFALNKFIISINFLQNKLTLALILICFNTASSFDLSAVNKRQASMRFKNSENYFVENKGQMTDDCLKKAEYVLFKAHSPGLNIWVTTSGLTYQFIKPEKSNINKMQQQNADNTQQGTEKESHFKKVHWKRVDMILKNASINIKNIVCEADSTNSFINYYTTGSINSIRGLKKISKLLVKDIYPGIDWVLRFNNDKSLKHEFIVRHNADITQIKLIYEGSGLFKIENNCISFENEFGRIKEGKLFCYQSNINSEVESHYIVRKNSYTTNLGAGNFVMSKMPTKGSDLTGVFSYEISVKVEKFDPTEKIIIDPKLEWGTYFGAEDIDKFNSVESDKNGNLFVTGTSSSYFFPTLNPGNGSYFQNGSSLVALCPVILKFDNNRNLIWSTYFYAQAYHSAVGIKLDSGGNIYITGYVGGISSVPNFPTISANGAYSQNYGGGSTDMYIAKFNGSGVLLWSTFYGGQHWEYPSYIDIDANNNIFVCGHTRSANLPIVANGSAFTQGPNASISVKDDIFIVEFNSIGALVWATYLGGANTDIDSHLAIDKSGNIFVGFTTFSTSINIVNSSGAYSANFSGGFTDIFMVKFNLNKNIQWSSYYGGNGQETMASIKTDYLGNVIICGNTQSNNLITVNPNIGNYFQSSIGGTQDIFIIKLSQTQSLIWATYFGGSNIDDLSYDHGWSQYSNDLMRIDNCGNIYITGATHSNNFPVINSYNNGYYISNIPSAISPPLSQFISQFENNGFLKWSTYSGATINGNSYAVDMGTALCMDQNGNLIVVSYTQGYSHTALFNHGGGAYFQSAPNNYYMDGFITELSDFNTTQSSIVSSLNYTDSICKNECNGSASASATGGVTPYVFTWYDNNWNQLGIGQSISNLCAGIYFVVVRDSFNCAKSDTSVINIVGLTTTTSISPTVNIISGQSAVITATGGGTYNWLLPANINGNVNNSISDFPSVTTIYCVEITGTNKCKDTICTTVFVESPCSVIKPLDIPNAFSPNNDNVNDEFCLEGWNNCIKSFEIIIYNRWGEKVYESNKPDFCWDGKFDNYTLDAQVFVYYIKAYYTNSNLGILKKGNISLIR